MTKKELREQFIREKLNLSEEQKAAADEIIFNKLIKHELFKQSDCILTYVSTRIEVDTKSIIEYSLMKGKTVAVPKCDRNSNFMKYYRISSLNDLERGSFNILEPNRFCSEQVETDGAICIVPALAFDKNCHRMGYGRGYFDRFLSENTIKSVGLCYKEFLVDELPFEGFDKAVDFVLTD